MAKRHLVPITIVATVLFASIGLTASAIEIQQGMPGAVEPTDVTLNDKVETLLRTDIGLAGSQFRVQTKAGVVTLSGNVPDEHSLRRALDLGSSVKGVRDIRNGMVVNAPK